MVQPLPTGKEAEAVLRDPVRRQTADVCHFRQQYGIVPLFLRTLYREPAPQELWL